MSAQKTLGRAERLLNARKYGEVISLLESQVFLYRESHAFYRILATACLYAGDFGGSYSYFQRAQQLKPGDTRVELGLAAVYLRRREIPAALQLWLGILDREPANSQARKGLALIRKTEDSADFVTMAESGALRRFFPSLGVRIPGWVPVGTAVLIGALIVALVVPPLVRTLLEARPRRQGAEALTRSELPASLTQPDEQARYVLTEVEVARLLDRVGERFNAFRDNLARRDANRLLLSNADPRVKERIRLVTGYFRVPTFVDFSDNFTYAEVAAEPWLYEGTHVRWSGQTTNIALDADAVRFTLLVGYEDERVLEGTVAVTVPFAADVQPGPIELIGRVTNTPEGFALTASSIRRLAPRTAR